MNIEHLEAANILLKKLNSYKRIKWMINFGKQSITMSFGNYPEQITINSLENSLKDKILNVLDEYYTSNINNLKEKINSL